MFHGYEQHFQPEIPDRPGAKYAHILVLRHTDSFAVFKTDGELNTARVRAGIKQNELISRLAIFKRKQTTPERLTGRSLLRRYEVVGDECKYNEDFCGKCPDCVLYGYAIGDTGSEKSKVYVDTAYSITSYDDSHETFTLNAPFEDGTMTKGGATTNRFSEEDHVRPETFFPSVVTLRDPTPNGLAYVINNLRRTKLYGAQTTRTGHVSNTILALIFADGEIFSNLRLTQAIYDKLASIGNITTPLMEAEVLKATAEAAGELVAQDGVVYELVMGADLERMMNELDAMFSNAESMQAFLTLIGDEAKAYAERVGVTAKKKGK